MQNRYFGDVGDFGKYGLLRRITGVTGEAGGERLSLGVVWYLVADQDQNKDGKHIGYLEKPGEYQGCDPELFDGLKCLLESGPRAVNRIERSSPALLPPGTKYVSDVVPPRQRRREWLRRAMEEVRDCDVVFLDPDKGFQPPSVEAEHKNAVKYVLWTEAEQFYRRHERQTLVFYHHLNRTKRWADQIAEKVREIRSRITGGDTAIPVLFKRGTGRVFFVVPSRQHRDLVARRVDGAVEDANWSKHMEIVAVKNESVRVGTWNVEWPNPDAKWGKAL